MNYCAPRGIPWGEFMGRVRQAGEPRWTTEDTTLAVEWQRLQKETCRGCGQSLLESLDPLAEYEVHDIVCHGCEAKEQKERALSSAENAHTEGRRVTVTYMGRRPEFPALTPSAGG